MFCENQKIVTVKDMYDYAKAEDIPLLGTYTPSSLIKPDFWFAYVANYSKYDFYFRTMYRDFFYFDQDGTQSVVEVFGAFQDIIDVFLEINDKKYSEMYRIELLSIDSNSILSDYKIVETKEATRDVDREYVSGEREDTNEEESGARTDVETNQVMAYNSTEFVDSTKTTGNKGAQTDGAEYHKGEQTDNETVNEESGHTITTSGTKGNPYENMTKYMEAWDGYSFYTKLFKDIAKEFLLV